MLADARAIANNDFIHFWRCHVMSLTVIDTNLTIKSSHDTRVAVSKR